MFLSKPELFSQLPRGAPTVKGMCSKLSLLKLTWITITKPSILSWFLFVFCLFSPLPLWMCKVINDFGTSKAEHSFEFTISQLWKRLIFNRRWNNLCSYDYTRLVSHFSATVNSVEVFSTSLFWIAVKWKIFEIHLKFSAAPIISRKKEEIKLLEQETLRRTDQAHHWLSFFLRTGLNSYFPEDLKPFYMTFILCFMKVNGLYFHWSPTFLSL